MAVPLLSLKHVNSPLVGRQRRAYRRYPSHLPVSPKTFCMLLLKFSFFNLPSG